MLSMSWQNLPKPHGDEEHGRGATVVMFVPGAGVVTGMMTGVRHTEPVY